MLALGSGQLYILARWWMLFKPAGDVSSLVVGLCVEDALTGELWEGGRQQRLTSLCMVQAKLALFGMVAALLNETSHGPRPAPSSLTHNSSTFSRYGVASTKRLQYENYTGSYHHLMQTYVRTCTHKHAHTKGYTTVQIYPAAMVLGAADFGSHRHSNYNFVMHSIITELWTKCESWNSRPYLYHKNCSCTNTHMTPW